MVDHEVFTILYHLHIGHPCWSYQSHQCWFPSWLGLPQPTSEPQSTSEYIIFINQKYQKYMNWTINEHWPDFRGWYRIPFISQMRFSRSHEGTPHLGFHWWHARQTDARTRTSPWCPPDYPERQMRRESVKALLMDLSSSNMLQPLPELEPGRNRHQKPGLRP